MSKCEVFAGALKEETKTICWTGRTFSGVAHDWPSARSAWRYEWTEEAAAIAAPARGVAEASPACEWDYRPSLRMNEMLPHLSSPWPIPTPSGQLPG